MFLNTDDSNLNNSWLHFFPHDQLGKEDPLPTSIVKADGIFITDQQGRKYIDAISGAYCVNVGYGRDSIIDAASKASKQLAFCSPFSFANIYAARLAQVLAKLAEPVIGPHARVFFTNSGSEAVETALKLARAFAFKKWEKNRQWLLSRERAYHGVTLGALSVCGFPSMREPFGPLMPKTASIPAITESVNAYQELISKTPEAGQDVAALLIETIETSNGFATPSPQYLNDIARFRKESGALLLIDEVITGFGRVGNWFSAQHYDLKADILICAKGLTSGYESLGATIVSERVASIFAHGDENMFSHGATFGGRPAAAAAALENIAILHNEKLLENAQKMGALIRGILEKELAGHPQVLSLTGMGLLLAIHLKTRAHESSLASTEEITRIRKRLLSNNVISSMYYMRNDPTIEIAPPLCITEEQCNQLCEAIVDALQ